MKKSAILGLVALLFSMKYQQASAVVGWIVVNATNTREGAYAVITTREKNQDILALLNPGDTGVYSVVPTNISVYSMADLRLLKSIPGPMDTKNPILIVLGGSFSESIYVDTSPGLSENPDRIVLLNATPYDAIYRLNYVIAKPLCNADEGSLTAGQLTTIHTKLCLPSTLQASFNVENKTVSISEYLKAALVFGLYIFREIPTSPGTFYVSGPWQSSTHVNVPPKT